MNTANLATTLPLFHFTLPARLLASLQRIAAPVAPVTPAAATTNGLDKGATTWISQPMGRTVSCEAGTLWLTFDNEPADVILEAGQSHCCAKTSKLAIHAMSAARVSVN
ncbi:MAG: DUF2917 domain-containing protein [Burkholderiales bacterium]|nr:MAG: DUF2917 domain-containing protein [Burkholderiales bacterium]